MGKQDLQPPFKQEDFVLNNFQTGIADSAMLGISNLKCLDIHSVPGAARVNFKANQILTQATTPSLDAPFPKIVRDPKNSTNLYAISSGGQKFYKSTDNGATWSTITNAGLGADTYSGIAIWKDYVFVTADPSHGFYLYGPLSGVPVVVGVRNLTTSVYHPMVAGMDDILYVGDGRYVASWQEILGQTFNPTNPATYTFTAQALTLPSDYNISCMAEFGVKLMLGTYKGTIGQYGNKVANIYPWDRTSTSFNLPIIINEFGIQAMQLVGNTLYVIAGTEGSIFTYNGYSLEPLRKLSTVQQSQLLQNLNTALTIDNFVYPEAVMAHKGRLFFANSYRSTAGIIFGIWSVDDKGVLCLENTVSDGVDIGTSNHKFITCLFSVDNEQYLIGWQDTSAGTITLDKVRSDSRAQIATVESPFVRVGTPQYKRKYTTASIQLTQPLASGQFVTLAYRTQNQGNYTTFGSFDYTTYGAKQSTVMNVSFPAVENLQIQVTMLGTATPDTPNLLEVRLS